MLNRLFWQRLIIVFLVCGSLLPGVILMPQTALSRSALAHGATKQAEGQCSLATLHGTYLFAFNGTVIAGSNQVLTTFAGWVAFDGSGHVHGFFSQSVSGKITRLIHFTGTYTIKENCTATETDTTDAGALFHLDEFTTPDGNQFAFVQTDPQVVASGIATRGTGQLLRD